MKKILKSELTPQLVKHREATLQLLNTQRDIYTVMYFKKTILTTFFIIRFLIIVLTIKYL